MPFAVNEKFILQTEQLLGVTFPPDFRLKMMQSNGGEIETDEDVWELYPFFDNSDQVRLKRTCNEIILETKQARKWNNFPSSGVAIARNGCGDQLLFLVDEADSTKLGESIYQWQHETGEVFVVAADIQELFAG